MCFWERVIIKLYFPQFKSPSASRFQNFFFDLNKYENSKGKKKEISYKIFPDKIMQGEDKRSSIIIKNIPKNMKKKDIERDSERKKIDNNDNIKTGKLNDDEINNRINSFLDFSVLNNKEDEINVSKEKFGIIKNSIWDLSAINVKDISFIDKNE